MKEDLNLRSSLICRTAMNSRWARALFPNSHGYTCMHINNSEKPFKPIRSYCSIFPIFYGFLFHFYFHVFILFSNYDGILIINHNNIYSGNVVTICLVCIMIIKVQSLKIRIWLQGLQHNLPLYIDFFISKAKIMVPSNTFYCKVMVLPIFLAGE